MSSLGDFVSELLSTERAGVGHVARMDPSKKGRISIHDHEQVSHNHDSASGTRYSVCVPVYKVGDPLPEALAASLALVGSLPAVNSLVILQGGKFLESSPALGAGVRLFVRVIQHVLVIRLLECKCTAAEIAFVGGFT